MTAFGFLDRWELLPVYEVEHPIGGQGTSGSDTGAIEVLNPATDEPTRAPIAGAEEVGAAIAGARVAAEGWSR